ncbi:MAG TPA: alpha/beta hydrolase [Gemmatimonadota bacterium]|nr:alpha/beta hydrolase [Gemmatimonadota bacterium]
MPNVDRERLTVATLAAIGLLCVPATGISAQLPQGAATPVELVPPPTVAEAPFAFERDGLTLHGTLAMPPSPPGRLPVVVIVAGSGPTDRNANGPFVNTNAYAMLAWGLAEQGIASLRYDKRGIGMSAGEGGDPTTLTTDHYVADVAAAATALTSDARFSKIILLGHSEGAGHVLQAANRGAPQAGVVMVAGLGRMLADVLHEQFALQADSTTVATIDSAFARFLRGEDPGEVPPIAQPVIVPQYRNFMRSMAAYDPTGEVRRFTGPLLILQGTTDVQVTMLDAELLHAAQPGSTLVRLEDVNHVLKSIATSDLQAQVETYRDPSMPLAGSVVPAIAGWIDDLDR